MEVDNPEELFGEEALTNNESDKLFQDEEEVTLEKEDSIQEPGSTWKVLIVDDEEDVHTVTKMVLKPYRFLGKELKFLDTYSGQESRDILATHPDIALVLLDVVMETNHAGLELVKYIREELGNSYTRIILRTGYPGQAPERKVIASYEINDYKTKTELTALKLYTAVQASLRSYASIMELESYRQSLEEKVKARTIELEEKNKTITDSIQYGSRIQNALLPQEEDLNRHISSYFIINKPKDIVSGDFYWLAEKENRLIVALADCTGHGVPGAFMSILGVALLNEIVNRAESITTDEILNQLRSKVIKALGQTGKTDEVKDGMEISVCMIDLENRSLQYSGALRPLYLVRDHDLIELKGDNLPIGLSDDSGTTYNREELICKEKDSIYLLSDGYTDQMGGPNRKTFRTKNFKQLLLEIQSRPMSEQKSILERRFQEWKGENEQIDDILVMGIRM
jgi:serine phosphatase RsbU (regulator of sigma subunit)